MICPNCAALCDDDLRYCDHCGADLTASEDLIPEVLVIETPQQSKPAPVPSAPVISAPKKGRLWPPILILALMIVAGTALFFLLPGTAPGPVEPVTQDAPWFTVENGVLSFHEEYYYGPSELTIPETVHGQVIIGISDYAFSGADFITTVVLPDSVTIIGDYAFSSCKNLRGIYIPDSVLSIGVYAFADCDDLEAIYIPGSIMELGHGSLDSCDSLKYILFDGSYSQWLDLYNGYFVSTVELHTIDGIYYTRP